MKGRQFLWDGLVKLFLVYFANKSSVTQSTDTSPANNGTIPALFAFGDSILDTGNNNNLNTLSKCNFPPYGKDFPGGVATGRFSDGKVPPDLIAQALGIKETLPAYSDPNLQSSDLPTGVDFASGGSGNDDVTANIQGVLTLSRQLQMFKEYIEKLKGVVGEERANIIIHNSLSLISAGNNDVAIAYAFTFRGTQYDFPSYADILVNWNSDFLKELYQLGVRKVGVLSTLPLGCLPGARTSLGGPQQNCVDLINERAQLFNQKLSDQLDSMKSSMPDFKLIFIDVYTLLLDIIQNPQQSGFANVANGCCGTGKSEMGYLCSEFNAFSCPNAADHVFWDAGHPTEHTYRLLVTSILQKYNLIS